MNAYQRGNRDGLLAFAAWAREAANIEWRENEWCKEQELASENDRQRHGARSIGTAALRRMAIYNSVVREAERMAQALPMDPEEVEAYKPSWVGDSRGYDQARQNPPVVVDGVTISVVRRESGN